MSPRLGSLEGSVRMAKTGGGLQDFKGKLLPRLLENKNEALLILIDY